MMSRTNVQPGRCSAFYIGGEWVSPSTSDTAEVVTPSTEATYLRVPLGTRRVLPFHFTL